MVKTNQIRKQDKTRSTQKKMPEPEVQQLHNVGPTVARWRVPDLTSFSFCTCPLYFAWVFLSYHMPSHFILILSLGPCILFYFFRGSTPPGNRRGSVGCWNSVKALCKYTTLASGGGKLTHGTSLPPLFLQGEGLEAESKVEISFKLQVS